MVSDPPQNPAEIYEDAMLDAAFSQLLQQEAEELMAQEPSEEEALLLAQLEARMPQQYDRLDRTLRRYALRKRVWAGTKSFLRTAAAILAIVFVGLSTAIAANKPFRQCFINFLTQSTPEYIAIGFCKTPTAPDIPEDWTAAYYPAYLPDGYELAGIRSNQHSSVAIFEKDADAITFNVYNTASYTQIDARNAETKRLQIHDREATLVTHDNQNTVFWSEDDEYFSVTASSPGIAIDVADSIARIPD
ncbi:MAG: DUF4367 domain-containing protein [Clostridia bacterium]|nr:DUF4367 domain-containing protein [Clostridia bacterium]